MDECCARLKIHGRVQGVFYRQSTVDMARQMALKGWVRNCPDGSVEALIAGPKNRVLQAIEWCRQGPPAAAVDEIVIDWEAVPQGLEAFRVRY